MLSFLTFWRDCRPGRVVHLCVLGERCVTGRVVSRSLLAVRLADHDGDNDTVRWWVIKKAAHGPTWEREFEGARKIAAGLREAMAKREGPRVEPITTSEIEAMLAERVQP